MSVHEKGGKQVNATPTHKTIYNPIPTSLFFILCNRIRCHSMVCGFLYGVHIIVYVVYIVKCMVIGSKVMSSNFYFKFSLIAHNVKRTKM